MPLYRDSVAGVRAQIAAGTLVPTMSEQFRYAYGHNPAPAEVRSWERSLTVLYERSAGCRARVGRDVA